MLGNPSWSVYAPGKIQPRCDSKNCDAWATVTRPCHEGALHEWEWTEPKYISITELKLICFESNRETGVSADASKDGPGAMLFQENRRDALGFLWHLLQDWWLSQNKSCLTLYIHIYIKELGSCVCIIEPNGETTKLGTWLADMNARCIGKCKSMWQMQKHTLILTLLQKSAGWLVCSCKWQLTKDMKELNTPCSLLAHWRSSEHEANFIQLWRAHHEALP